jgi:uncharacterized protein (TIGR00369 family)
MLSSELQALLDQSPLHRGMGLRITELTEDSLTLEGEAGEIHVNSGGASVVHGGVLALILDTAATFVLMHATGADWSTVDLRVDFLRPVPTGPLRARAVPDHIGRRVGRASAVLVPIGRSAPHARAVGTFVRLEPQSQSPPAEAEV